MIRNAIAVWNGSGKEGGGHLTTQSTVLNKTQYSFNSRFENGVGTNPEELVAAAHAGCFSMKLAFDLGGKGFIPKTIETSCNITFENGVLSKSHLIVKASIEGINPDQFKEIVEGAKDNCPISKVLNTEISFEATLLS
jgi:osmotically inducible protein OsmC